MTHWGWYWRIKRRHIPKPICTSYKCLYSFEFFKKGMKGFSLDDKYETKGRLEAASLAIFSKLKNYVISIEKQSSQDSLEVLQ
jgi:hypothetical protein